MIPSAPILQIKGLHKVYDNGVEALKGIDLDVKQGDFFALLGANGAGKSTTIGAITTLITKTAGTIVIDGHDLDKEPDAAKFSIGLVPQEFNLNIFERCEQILINQAGFYGIPRHKARAYAHNLLKQLGLWEKKDEIVRHLSGGMKRRLMIARALIHKPKLLILDEPTAGVDVEIRRSMWDFLTQTNAEGTTIILTTHYLEEAEQLCKNIAIINQGQLVENTSIDKLLKTLRHQTFVLNTQKPLAELPDLKQFEARLIDSSTLELRVNNELTLNEVFSILTSKGLQIQSLRNKTNRLEELFLDLINHAH